MKILVAEDDELLRNLLISFLNEAGHSVQGASDGMELVKLALENKPDLIFTDLNMPNMSGDTMIAMIESHSELSSLPIIVISGAPEKEIKDMALSKDIIVLSKPFDFEKISAELKKIEDKLKP